MCQLSNWSARQSVKLVPFGGVGSNPTWHTNGSLAQWIRAFRYGRKGWGFESLRNHITHASGEKVSYQSPKLLLGVRVPPGVQNQMVEILTVGSVVHNQP